MEPAEFKKLEELFYCMINKVEKEYYLYFGLKSIQKQSSCEERIYDHFILDKETQEIHFRKESDLPLEIRDIITNAYEQVFLETGSVSSGKNI